MAIQSLDDIKQYLDAQSVEYVQVEELTGGTANYVYRLTKPDGDTAIIKHAEPFVRSHATIAFPVERMDFEAAALGTIGSRLPHDDVVNAAQLHSYDQQQHVLIMSDGGPRNLKEAYADPAIDVKAYGYSLGKWLANLHRQTRTADIGDNKVAKAIYQYSYQHLSGAMKENGFETETAKMVENDYAKLLLTDDECVCHGDFWPGNVLVSADGRLTIVDWEMTRRGISATDVAQFAAEALLLDRFKGGRGLLDAFLLGYTEGVGGKEELSDEWKTRFAVHCGTHLGYWPTRVPWADEEQTRQVVSLGRDVIVHGVKGDWAFFRSTPLGAIL